MLNTLDASSSYPPSTLHTMTGDTNSISTTINPAFAMGLVTSPSSHLKSDFRIPNLDPSKVYDLVTVPYDYREGFHHLVNYIKER